MKSELEQGEYGFGKVLEGTVAAAQDKVVAALAAEGFGILTEIDVKATLKKKIDVDFREYRILGACNPQLAHKAIRADGEMGLLLPCNVVVQEEPGGKARVSIADPRSMFTLTNTPGVEPIAAEARERLLRVIDALD